MKTASRNPKREMPQDASEAIRESKGSRFANGRATRGAKGELNMVSGMRFMDGLIPGSRFSWREAAHD